MPYTVYGKTFEGENFRGFLANRESFPVNGVFCAQPRKFSPSKVLPYTVFATITRNLL